QYVLLPNARGGYRRRNVYAYGKAAPTTTERPLVRVWNSFVRSVQPTFSFRNLTNPLANFFNDGSANIIETSPVALQSYDEQEQELQLEEPYPVAPSNSNKRKRKRRKQQKRRPVYDSEEFRDPYDPYFPQSPPLSPAQPMYFFDTNSGNYYGVQRYSPLDFQNNFYPYPNQQQAGSGEEESQQTEDLPLVRRLGPRKVTLLRPLTSAQRQSQSQSVEVIEQKPTNESEGAEEEENESELNDSTATSDPTSSDATGEDDSDIPTHSPLSESMRNTLGTYMRDDRHNRQRQRKAGVGPAVFDSAAKDSPRYHPRRVFRLGAW
ncbi:hypothetical protein KR009_006923, partial [Drosophila setifemur]